MSLLYAVADLDEWTRGVLFPLAVILTAGAAGWSARCLTNIWREFRTMRDELREIRHALRDLGVLEALDE